MHRGHQKPHFLGQLLAHPLDPRQQLATLVAIDQRNQAVAHFQADHIHRRHVIPAQFLDLLRALRRQQFLLTLYFLDLVLLHHALLVGDPVGCAGRHQAQADKGEMRHARHQADGDHDRGRHRQGAGRGEHLAIDLSAHILGAGNPGHSRV